MKPPANGPGAKARAPRLVRAPGIGLALSLTEGESEAFNISDSRDALSIATAFAELVAGLPPTEGLASTAAAGAQSLLKRWLALGGAEAPPLAPGTSTFKPSSLAVTAASLTAAHGNVPAGRWEYVQSRLSSKGLRLRRRGEDQESGLLAVLGEVFVYEVLDARGKVLSEGKGWNRPAGAASALGEAVERLTAQTAPTNLTLARQSQLAAQGVPTPRLQTLRGDLFSDDLPLEWTPSNTLSGRCGAIPAELVYYPFAPRTGVRGFAGQHTAGLAAGASAANAASAGFRECIETDAYWLSMRTKQVCGSYGDLRDASYAPVRRLCRKLADHGVRVWAGSIAFDWPLSVSHVVLQTEGESLPALAHGLGSGTTHLRSVERALLEAVQVYSGLEKVSQDYWPEIVLPRSLGGEPAIAWSSHDFADRVIEPFRLAPLLSLATPSENAIADPAQLGRVLGERGIEVWIAELGAMEGLPVVRAYLEGAVSPFSERAGPSERVLEAARRYGLPYPYMDPILT